MSIIDQIVNVESSGNATARNRRSSATGAGQFIASTWLSTLARHRPELTAGRSRSDILALRNDPNLSRQMTAAYASDNNAGLRSAGFDTTPGNTYLAHFAGLGGARKVLGADPSTPVRSLLGDGVVRANPFLANYTAGDLRSWADAKMSGRKFRGGGSASASGGAAGGDIAMDNPQALRDALRGLFGVETDDEMFQAFDGLLAQLAGDAGVDLKELNG